MKNRSDHALWTKREAIASPAAGLWTDIWDGDGWQINRKADNGKFLLLDAVMPYWVPASSVYGEYDTLEEAMAAAAEEGRPDWTGVPETTETK